MPGIQVGMKRIAVVFTLAALAGTTSCNRASDPEAITFNPTTAAKINSSIVTLAPPVTVQSPVAGSVVSFTSLEEVSLLGESEASVVHAALQRSVLACMKAQGMTYAMEPFVPLAPSSAASYYPDESLVRQYGYMYRGVHSSEEQVDEASVDEASAAQLGRCSSAAAGELGFDKYLEATQIFNVADSEIKNEARTGIALEGVVQTWVECMHGKGYTAIATLPDARQLAAELPGGPESSEGIAVALADLECQRSVEFEEQYRRTVSDLANEWIEGNPGALEQLREVVHALVERAEAMPS